MNEEGTINVDFIGLVSVTETGLLEYKRLPIPKLFDEEMQMLQAMCDNGNRTVMDLQDYFQRFMPKHNPPKVYSYCAPYSYRATFIADVQYPKMLSFGEYQSLLKEAEQSEITSFIAEKEAKNVSELTNSQRAELYQIISDKKAEWKQEIKEKLAQLQESVDAPAADHPNNTTK